MCIVLDHNRSEKRQCNLTLINGISHQLPDLGKYCIYARIPNTSILNSVDVKQSLRVCSPEERQADAIEYLIILKKKHIPHPRHEVVREALRKRG